MITPHRTLPSLPALTSDTNPQQSDLIWTGNMADLAVMAASLPNARSTHFDRWMDGTMAGGVAAITSGDLSAVPASDTMLSRFEKIRPVTRRYRTADAMTGGAPNIGAYLAGSPLAMRRRTRESSDTAPLTIVVDLTSSGGVDVQALRARGAAILALVRLLSASRPVELWAGCAGSPDVGKNGFAFARLDTGPLDLARAAPILSAPIVQRGILYDMLRHMIDGKHLIRWNYGDVEKQRRHAHAIFERILPGASGTEIFYIPPAFIEDELVSGDPAAWLESKLDQYGTPPEA